MKAYDLKKQLGFYLPVTVNLSTGAACRPLDGRSREKDEVKIQ